MMKPSTFTIYSGLALNSRGRVLRAADGKHRAAARCPEAATNMRKEGGCSLARRAPVIGGQTPRNGAHCAVG